jgi:broad specificity phosphatase PhoE
MAPYVLLQPLLLLLLQLSHVLQKRYEHFDAVVSSDLQRTLQTAQILAAPYQLQVSPGVPDASADVP